MSSLHPYVRAALDEIKAQPHDDTPRLMLADWLEENGDEADHDRAQVLRLGCQAAALPAWDPLCRIHDAAARALVRKHRQAWLGDVPLGTVTLDRGLFRVHLHEQDGGRARQVLAAPSILPWLGSVELARPSDNYFTPAEPPLPFALLGPLINEARQLWLLELGPLSWRGLFDHIDTTRLTALHSDCWMPPPDLNLLWEQPFDSLQELSIHEPPNGAIRSWPGLRNVRKLHLVGEANRSPWPGVCPVLEELTVHNVAPTIFEAGDAWPALRHLTVHEEGKVRLPNVLARSGVASRLESLNLHNAGRTVGMAALTRGPATRLRRLRLSAHVAGSDAFRAIDTGATLPALRDLCLADTDLDPAAVAVLTRSPLLDHLDALDLPHNRGNSAAAAALAELPALDRLQHLGLADAHWSADDFTALARRRDLSRLRSLDLSSTPGRPGHAVTPELFPNLIALNLANAVGSQEFDALLTWPILPQLRVLDLSDNWLYADAVHRLLDAPQLAEAAWVRITAHSLSPDLRAAWLDRFGPDSVVESDIPF